METHQESIQSGGEGPTVALLQEAQHHATNGTSEKSPESADGNDLYTETSPLLDAARCGDSKAFSSLIEAREPPSTELAVLCGYLAASVSTLAHRRQRIHATVHGGNSAAAAYTQLFADTFVHKLKEKIKATDDNGRTVLALAALSGKRDTFDTVLSAVKKVLHSDEVNAMIRAKDSRGLSLLAFAAESADKDIFEAVQQSLEEELTEVEMYDLIASEKYIGSKLLLRAVQSNQGKDLGLMKAVLKAVGSYLNNSNFNKALFSQNKELRGQELLCEAIQCCEIDLSKSTVELIPEHLVATKTARTHAEEINEIFSEWIKAKSKKMKFNIGNAVKEETGKKIKTFVSRLSQGNKLLDWIKMCLPVPLVYSENPLVPGLKLLLALSRAAGETPEGERRSFLSMQKTVETFLLEKLERFPQTVRGCKGRVECADIFGPANDKNSPLQMMMSKREHRRTFSKVPLVMDYLSFLSSCGLPGPLDTYDSLGDKEVMNDLAKGGLVLDSRAVTEPMERNASVLALLQGTNGNFPGLAHIPFVGPCPGLQFITAGIVVRPSEYYRVPMLRLSLNFVVYVVMLYFFTIFLRSSDGDLTLGEISFFVSLLAAEGIREVREMARDWDAYVQDGWNALDVLGLGMILVGLIFRLIDSASPTGQALYALSTPVVFARVLFFAQVLPFQGPMIQQSPKEIVRGYPAERAVVAFVDPGMGVRTVVHFQQPGLVPCIKTPWIVVVCLYYQWIAFGRCNQISSSVQVIFSMFEGLFQFGFIMVAVMMGFVVAFFALFPDVNRFDETSLILFKALFGEVTLFDDFGDQIRDRVATAILIVYLITMNIVFLNLLIAMLSTSYSKVDENAEREFKVSKVRMILYYQKVVEEELLPPPFNLAQGVFSFLFALTGVSWYEASRLFGEVIFWLVLGPVAVVVAVLMWSLSFIYALFAWIKNCVLEEKLASVQRVIITVCYVPLALVCLVTIWFGIPFLLVGNWLNISCCQVWNEDIGSTDFSSLDGAPNLGSDGVNAHGSQERT